MVRHTVELPTLVSKAEGGLVGTGSQRVAPEEIRPGVGARTRALRQTDPSNVFEPDERSEWGELFDATPGRVAGGQSARKG